MSVNLVVELPYPPSVNHYWCRARRGLFVSRKGVRYRSHVVAILRALGTRPISGPLSVSVELYPPDQRKRDVDNVLKALLDALAHGGAYSDDAQIVRLAVEKRKPVPGGKAVVAIRRATCE